MSNIIQLSADQFQSIQNISDSLSGRDATVQDILSWNQKSMSHGRSRVQKYDDYMESYGEMKDSTDPEVIKALADANDPFASVDAFAKSVGPAGVHQNATLSNVSIQYANEQFIGLQLMPIVQVAKESDIYYLYPRGERMQYPDDTLGDRGRANEIHETRNTATYTTLPRGLSNYVAQRTLNNQDSPLDEFVDLTESINEGLDYLEEQRIAIIMGTTGNFGAGQFATLAGATQWSSTGGGSPIANIQTARAAIWQGRGPSRLVAYSNLDVFNVLSRHQSILDLFKYNGSSPGLATPDMIAGFFGISKYLIGEARSNTAVEGDADVFARLWGPDFGIVRVARRPTRRNASFGYTFRQGQKLTVVEYDALAGHGGGYIAQVSHSETHLVVASPTGYLIEDAVA